MEDFPISPLLHQTHPEVLEQSEQVNLVPHMMVGSLQLEVTLVQGAVLVDVDTHWRVTGVIAEGGFVTQIEH
jgi:hypothetical protein